MMQKMPPSTLKTNKFCSVFGTYVVKKVCNTFLLFIQG